MKGKSKEPRDYSPDFLKHLNQSVFGRFLKLSSQTQNWKRLNSMSHLSAEQKASLYETFGGAAANTGSVESQIAQLTERINHISSHLKSNKKDFSTHRGLMRMVGRRKRLLQYMSKTNLTGYRALIEKLGLRK